MVITVDKLNEQSAKTISLSMNLVCTGNHLESIISGAHTLSSTISLAIHVPAVLTRIRTHNPRKGLGFAIGRFTHSATDFLLLNYAFRRHICLMQLIGQEFCAQTPLQPIRESNLMSRKHIGHFRFRGLSQNKSSSPVNPWDFPVISLKVR